MHMKSYFSRLFSSKKRDIKHTFRSGEPDVFGIESDDDKMNWAIEKAQLTLDYFIASLSDTTFSGRYVSAKVKIKDGESVEHIWLTNPEFDIEGNLFGVIGNVPLNISNVHLGQRVGVELSQITDWMIVDQGRLIGGYTIRAIRDKIGNDDDLNRFDEELGNILIDDGEDYFPPNFETPEGAILCIENAYDEGDIDKVLNCKDFLEEAKLMLQKNGMLEKFNEEQKYEAIKMVGEALQLSFINGIETNGMPDFRNCRRAFILREKLSSVHWIITEVVYHPDGSKTSQRINTYLTDLGWRVLSPE